jgi:reverse gyrase
VKPDKQDQTFVATGDGAALEQIMAVDLGQPAPLEKYHRPLSAKLSSNLESRLDDVERAQSDAAARLPTLYAD